MSKIQFNVELPDGYRLRVNHLHQGNTSKNQRHGHSYITIARIFDAKNKEVAKGQAFCSRRDTPRRSTGRALAVSRAIAAL